MSEPRHQVHCLASYCLCVWPCEARTQSTSERVTENHHNKLSLFHDPKIRNKVRPVSVHYGTGLLVAKYGTIPYFTGRLATLLSVHATAFLSIIQFAALGFIVWRSATQWSMCGKHWASMTYVVLLCVSGKVIFPKSGFINSTRETQLSSQSMRLKVMQHKSGR